MAEKTGKKITAAGDEVDQWQERSLQEIADAGLEDAIDFAARELRDLRLAGVFEQGPEWTRLWYELELARPTGNDGPIELADSSAEKLLAAANTCAHAFDLMMEVMCSRLKGGVALPPALGKHAAEHLEGRKILKRPPRNGRGKPEIWARNFMLNYTASLLGTFYDLGSERGKETTSVAASDVLFHALERNGTPLKLGTIQNNLVLGGKDDEPVCDKAKDFEEFRSLIVMSVLEDLPD